MEVKSFLNLADTDAQNYIRSANALKPRSAFVITFGCQQNEADSERIRGILCDVGFSISDTYDDADLIILNTCAIRAHAEDKVFSLLGTLKAQKSKNPELVIGVCGCMAAESVVISRLKRKFPHVAFSLEPNSLHLLPSLIFGAMERNERSFAYGIDTGGITEDLPVVRTNGYKAWVSVMYGCNNFCSYCIVPYVRGRERSRRSGDVISECSRLVWGGVKEITLLGQNVNSYKSDIGFAELLRKVAELDGDFTVRFMTSHPKDVSDELISVMAEYKGKIAPYFHLPLQSGSSRILKAMNRTYDREGFLNVVERLRAAIPDIVLSTDVIVGFPGETEEDFLDTIDVLHRVRFDAVYGFIYSEREGTRAASFENKVENTVKSERLARLFKEQDPISTEKNSLYIGRLERVFVNSISENGIANAVTVSGKLVRFRCENIKAGDFVNVEITKANPYELTAEMIK